jgi:cytochrome c oxidase subunit IV
MGLPVVFLSVLLGRTVALNYAVPLGPFGLLVMLALVANRARGKWGPA